MSDIPSEPEKRVLAYLSGKRQIEDRRLGSGTDGEVFIVTGPSAIKVHYHNHRYSNELRAYQLLTDLKIDHIGDFRIPTFRHYDNKLMIIEMSVVKPPYLIDFGKATIGQGQDWDEEHISHWWDQVAERFEQDAPTATRIFERLRRMTDIHQWDLTPSNLNFGPLSKNNDGS